MGPSKPSAAAVASRSIGKPVPASAAEPSGHRFIRARASAKPRAIARDHLVIGHQMMAERHRLRALEMGEAGHHAVGMLLGAGEQRVLQGPPAPPRPDRSHRAPRGGNRSRPGRCASARCGAAPRDRPDRCPPAAPRRACGCLRARDPRARRSASNSAATVLESRRRSRAASSAETMPCAPSIAACAFEPRDILPPQSLVERDRGVYLAHDRGRAFGEAPTPHGIGAVLALDDRASPARCEPDRRLR